MHFRVAIQVQFYNRNATIFEDTVTRKQIYIFFDVLQLSCDIVRDKIYLRSYDWKFHNQLSVHHVTD